VRDGVFCDVVLVMFAAQPQVCIVLCEISKYTRVCEYTKMADVPVWDSTNTEDKLASLKSGCHTITNKCQEALLYCNKCTKHSFTLKTLPDANWLKCAKSLSGSLL
jgi:hypothetical protein